MTRSEIQEKIDRLPLTSGVYLMKDAAGRVIYVGKAVSLRRRVQSYFRKNRASGLSKTDLLVADIREIDHIPTNSEAEALILEASLIKKCRPKYNIDLRDDKSYPYIEITGGEFPRIRIVRPRDQDRNVLRFGPYINPRLIREALTILRKIFPFCVCDTFPKKECLDHHLGLCPAPCTGRISRKDYGRNIRNIRMILEGRKDELLRNLQAEMEELSRERKYESAAKVRDQIRALGALFSGTRDVNYYKEAEQLQRAFGLFKVPQRIEAFDVSNIMGQHCVGSMVSFLNGIPDKKNYRRFRIKTVTGIDDFQGIAELVRRRYRRLLEEGALLPDLVLIDGGKGQLSAAQEELARLGLELPLAALAKREEEVFLPRRRMPVILPPDSLGLKLLQRVRDEAHRFAVNYHRLLRAKKALGKA